MTSDPEEPAHSSTQPAQQAPALGVEAVWDHVLSGEFPGVTREIVDSAQGFLTLTSAYKRLLGRLADDVKALESGQRLPSLAEPKKPPRRRAHNKWLCYSIGIVIGVIAGFVIGFLIISSYVRSVVQYLTELGDEVFPLSFMVACGGIALGFVLGAVFWLLEVRARLKTAKKALEYAIWQMRENVRSQLDSGGMTRRHAAKQLREDL